jgi:hypothetical protein
MAGYPARNLTLSLVLLVMLAGPACTDQTSDGDVATAPAEAPSPSPTPAAPIPAGEIDLYRTLASRLDAIAASLPPATPTTTKFGAELLPANGNAGEALLTPQAMQAVALYLDALQGLGVQGVSLQISDPLLAPDFPRSDEYLQFFKAVAAEVRARGLLLLVETGPVFAGTEYSSVQVGGRWPANEAYFRDRGAQIVRIATEVRPDYLSMGNEPQTEQMLTGLRFTLDEYVAFLQRTAAAVPRGATKLGAGTGTWEDPAWARRIVAEVPVDFLDLHLYPLSNGRTDYVQRLVDLTREARAAGKEVLVGESWLYKVTDAEVQQGGAIATRFARDYYDFWAPLDARFVDVIGRLAAREGVTYVSFFWSKYLFAYLPFTPDAPSRPAQDLIRASNQAALDAMRRQVISPAGEALRRLTTTR